MLTIFGQIDVLTEFFTDRLFTQDTIDHMINTMIILLIGSLSWLLIKSLVAPLIKSLNSPQRYKTKRDKKLRDETLISTTRAGLRALLFVVILFALLSEFGINLAPLLAGAGIIGVALGFGAQSLVKDYLAGLYVLIENQYRVGDVVRLNDEVSGVVEIITLRQTVLRDLDGMQHHVPNGTIRLATNMTMDFASVNLDVGVAYNTDIEKLEKIINDVGQKMADDENWTVDIYEPPMFNRVDEFGDSAIIVKITGRTAPMRQWDVTGELRKRLKIAFDKAGIEIPYPHRTVITKK